MDSSSMVMSSRHRDSGAPWTARPCTVTPRRRPNGPRRPPMSMASVTFAASPRRQSKVPLTSSPQVQNMKSSTLGAASSGATSSGILTQPETIPAVSPPLRKPRGGSSPGSSSKAWVMVQFPLVKETTPAAPKNLPVMRTFSVPVTKTLPVPSRSTVSSVPTPSTTMSPVVPLVMTATLSTCPMMAVMPDPRAFTAMPAGASMSSRTSDPSGLLLTTSNSSGGEKPATTMRLITPALWTPLRASSGASTTTLIGSLVAKSASRKYRLSVESSTSALSAATAPELALTHTR
mmetsp:Transcript_7065/g.16956  ORF Transcript_7065/g.16956 Transcript_7065/m.16956 type:complete len:290 (-) Transcript_7065:572-1441(-)